MLESLECLQHSSAGHWWSSTVREQHASQLQNRSQSSLQVRGFMLYVQVWKDGWMEASIEYCPIVHVNTLNVAAHVE